MSYDFLVEIGCEELPPKALPKLIAALSDGIEQGLNDAKLTFDAIEQFAAPRRLAVRVKALLAQQGKQHIERRGPAVSAAFSADGEPSKACMGFARSCGVEVSQLQRLTTDKGEWLVYRAEKVGQTAVELLPEIVKKAIAGLPIPKPMRWGAHEVTFVRPVHWLVMLYGSEVVPATLLNQEADQYSLGHRFHHPERVLIETPCQYESALEKAKVIASFSKRREIIAQQVTAKAQEHEGLAVISDELLDEVTALVEWPNAMLIDFDEAFLDVPKEALIAAMESHQKCFALTNHDGRLLAKFITVSNIDSQKPQQVIKGNQKVMRARLSDADFFYQQDKKNPLSDGIERTKKVVFQAKLGSLFDKTQRIEKVALFLAPALSLSTDEVVLAAQLSKCDLMSEMVGEFPELQGTMGRYYAQHDKLPLSVADALYEQYLPRFSGDVLPATDLGSVLALAERVDTLVGIFGIGQKPSGTKDPFKLRRAALGVIRILAQSSCDISLDELLNESIASFGTLLSNSSVLKDVKQFILDRLTAQYQQSNDEQRVSADLVKSVLAIQDDSIIDIEKRIKAMKSFVVLSEASALTQANKRVGKLLAGKKNTKGEVIESLFDSVQERDLYQALLQKRKDVEPLLKQHDYQKALTTLVSLREPIDAFFEHVMVMAEDDAIRVNRLNLLDELHQLFLKVADISLLQIT